MPTVRFLALEETMGRKPKNFEAPGTRVSDYFGSRVFNRKAMREYMTSEAYKAVIDAMDNGTKINRSIADQVASGMKAWALNLGATHYTHWFQPLTGASAEKHDAFFEYVEGGIAMEKFSGGMLVQQEPDASSFPNGGIRNTFEARGYTAWDPTSPAFVFGTTLCIPTVFVSYTGEALDYKTPLLRALQAVDAAATDVCKYFDKNVNKVNATLGWEQEYFLVDEAYFHARPDLTLAGRALVGHAPAKGQQLDDHYFGSIPERAIEFMKELEYESRILGIPVKTRHNEVAPAQYEFAPVFEEANVAVDHNSLFMDLIEKVARRHNFRVLLHEKPFANINGSGKHNNWSLATNTGVNLLAPGSTPMSNLMFLTFFVNSIKAVHRHADLIRASIGSAGNEHRLGANEAPPAIISVFIGDQLSKVLDQLENIEGGKMTPDQKTDLKLNVVGKIPEILLDNTDRNRTSPFAFTGNKFEFRAVGSSDNCSSPMVVLNAIVANQLVRFKKSVDEKINSGSRKEDAIEQILRETLKGSKNVIFGGNGYSDEWVKEAEKRGLSNVRNTAEALQSYLTEKSREVFIDNNIFSEKELEARTEIRYESYVLSLEIESKVLSELVQTHVIPSAIRYQSRIAQNLANLKSAGIDLSNMQSQVDLVNKIGSLIDRAQMLNKQLMDESEKAISNSSIEKAALAFNSTMKPLFDDIREVCDEIERICDDTDWNLPKYRELLTIA